MSTTSWKEILELLTAGSQMVPLADNDSVYRELEQRLDSLRTGAQPPDRHDSRPKAA